VYADNLRRIAKAEPDYYEANIERRLRAEGLDERQLIEIGTQLADRVIGLLERALLMVYRRHREHLWTEHAINHVEEALEGSGLQQRVPQPPAICFVDLTGYTRLTEERGDEAAVQVARRLVALVNDISRRRVGRPIRLPPRRRQRTAWDLVLLGNARSITAPAPVCRPAGLPQSLLSSAQPSSEPAAETPDLCASPSSLPPPRPRAGRRP
jgi:class 3 adenylate cyclase